MRIITWKNEKDSNHFGLYYAVGNGSFELTDLLLDSPNIDVNNKDCYNWTALMSSCAYGRHSCPEWEYKIKNVLLDRTMILMLHGPIDSKMLSWKILPLGPKKLTLP